MRAGVAGAAARRAPPTPPPPPAPRRRHPLPPQAARTSTTETSTATAPADTLAQPPARPRPVAKPRPGGAFGGRADPASTPATSSPATSSPSWTTLPSDPSTLIGWRILHARSRALVGVVAAVVPPPAPGAPPSLRVVNADVDAKYGPGAAEAHTLPCVADVLPAANAAERTLLATPPPGLLRLGRQRLILDYLRPALRSLARQDASSARGGGLMPTRADLVAAGRADLADDVDAAGGFAAVAAAVGLRSRRRPVGYWDNLDALDAELSLFVAAHWVELAAPGGATAARRGGRYFYNVATRRVRWDAPVAPAEIAFDDQGGAVRVEDEGDHLMPGRAAVLAAGRYDLHHAIVYHGGYGAVGDALDRPPAWPPSRAHRAPRDLAAELRAFASAGGGARRRVMPTADELVDAGRGDLLQAVVAAGGARAAARAAGLASRRRADGEMADLAVAAAALAAFARKAGTHPAAPTQAALAAAGRWDLRYAAALHGAARLAGEAGLAAPRRGRPRKRE